MGLELLGGLAGKVLGVIGAVAAILFAWWAKGKAGERKGLQKATEAAREKEREAHEEVARLRGQSGLGRPFDSLPRVEKPLRGPTDPPPSGKPQA